MTDNELKELVAGLAVSNAENAKELAKFIAENARLQAEYAKVQADNAKVQADNAKAHAEYVKTQEIAQENVQAEVRLLFKETEDQMKKTDETLKRMGINLGGISENMGSYTEDYFYNSLSDNIVLGGIQFDEIGKNVQRKSKRLEDEYDIVLYNGDCIALIECKYKAHEKDLRKLIDKKVENFRELFPYYRNYKIYLGLASFSFYPELETLAKESGVAILKQKGDLMEIEADNLKAY